MERICSFQIQNLLKNVEKAFQEDIKKRIEIALQQMQHRMKADIVGFGKEFYRKYPKQWKQNENRWERCIRKWK